MLNRLEKRMSSKQQKKNPKTPTHCISTPRATNAQVGRYFLSQAELITEWPTEAAYETPAHFTFVQNLTHNFLFYRIIEWFGLERTLKIIWFQPPCHEQGHLPPDQVAQSSIQPGLEPCQGGGSHSSSGQPGPGFHHPHGFSILRLYSWKTERKKKDVWW